MHPIFHSIRRAATCLAAVLAAVAILPATAAGHAQLVSVEQVGDPHGAAGPRAVELRFDEPVTPAAAYATVRDSHGHKLLIGRGRASAGWSRLLRVPLPRLAAGRWTIALEVLSADGHLSKVAVKINVPHGASPAPVAATVETAPASPGLEVARALARGARDGGLALAAGLAVALFAVWLSALRFAAGATNAWRDAAADGLRRWVLLTRLTTAIAAVAAPLTVALDASGAALPSALWSSRAGQAAAGITLAALVLRAAATTLCTGRTAPVLKPAVVGSSGLVLAAAPVRLRVALLVPAAALVVLAPLGGHAAGHGPTGFLAPAAVGHVAAVSLWLGALATLLVTAATTKALPADDRRALVVATGARVARIAPLAVAAVVATGLAQAAFHLHGPTDLVAIAWGRLVLAKAFLLVLMLAWAARNRRALEHDDAALARGVGSELALAAFAVLAAAVLAGAAPPT